MRLQICKTVCLTCPFRLLNGCISASLLVDTELMEKPWQTVVSIIIFTTYCLCHVFYGGDVSVLTDYICKWQKQTICSCFKMNLFMGRPCHHLSAFIGKEYLQKKEIYDLDYVTHVNFNKNKDVWKNIDKIKTVMECVKWILNGFAPFTKGMYFFKGSVVYSLLCGDCRTISCIFWQEFKTKI